MNLVLDFTRIYAFFALPGDEQMRIFLLNFGWIPIAFVILHGTKDIWINYIQKQWGDSQKFIVLAIDIQRGNEQTIKAAENLFVYFAGAHSNPSLVEKYWDGLFQLSFSFEIVSIEGYTQFLINTASQFRNLVETAIYSQYPDAEITEVNDYTQNMPRKFPDKDYDVWGSEFMYSNNEAYPIKTYLEFEDSSAARPEHKIKDPMASFMDLCSSLGPGEQLWFQMIVIPVDFKWAKDLNAEVGKLLKEKSAPKQGQIGKAFSELKSWINEITTQMFSFSFGDGVVEEKKDDSLRMMNLKPQEKKKIEAIQNKISKIGFQTKIRMLYVAKKEVMNKPKVVNGFNGYIKQFSDLDLNGLKPDSDRTATSTAYFFKDMRANDRKQKIMSGYVTRDPSIGRNTKLFNVEELATLWHFPVEAVVKAPLIQKAPGRKSEPPMSLPFEEEMTENTQIFRSEENIFSDDHDFSEEASRADKRLAAMTKKDDGLDELFSIEEDEDDASAPKKIIKSDAVPKSTPPSNLPFA